MLPVEEIVLQRPFPHLVGLMNGRVGRFGRLQVPAVDGHSGQASPQGVVLHEAAQLQRVAPPATATATATSC